MHTHRFSFIALFLKKIVNLILFMGIGHFLTIAN